MAKYTQNFCVSILVIYFLYLTSNTYRIQRGHSWDVPAGPDHRWIPDNFPYRTTSHRRPRENAEMTLAVDFQPEGRFAQALVDGMNARDLTIRQLAERSGMTYEHIRKLAKGAAYPSKLALRELCHVLDLDERRMDMLAVADRLEKKYGGIPHELAGKHPGVLVVARWGGVLTEEKKNRFCIQIKNVGET